MLTESQHQKKVDGLFEDWFLDYASYVILDRAIPSIEDGLKPVQRRLLYALKELDDGRFNKAANVIGHTMRYHPHGDMAISDALVKLAQRHFLIDTQGNWGNVATGDRAAASRYIEARLSKFAKEVAFSSPIPKWQLSYDGRNKEPLTLPVKFPLLLVHGAEGIAVGLSTKILPHNFVDVAKAAIAYLAGKPFHLYPDFATGGCIDVSDYQDGRSGGKLLMRVGITRRDDRTLVIDSLPFGITTSGLIDSILAAVDKGKLKVRKIEDNTADSIEIVVRLAPGADAEQIIKALYAFTDCETSYSPSACVIKGKTPTFCSVGDILADNVDRTMAHLKAELVARQHKLTEQLHFLSLEQVFIREKIYRKIEKAESYEQVLGMVERGLAKFASSFVRSVTSEDVVKLTEIKIKRISKYDQGQADEQMAKIREMLAKIEKHLKNLRQYTTAYFKHLIKEYGDGFPRRTEIQSFDRTKAAVAALANIKLYINRKDGFIGTGLRDQELLSTCTAFSEILVVDKKGHACIHKVDEKTFVGKHPVHVQVFDAKQPCHVAIVSTTKDDGIWLKHCALKMVKGRPQQIVSHDKAKVVAVYAAGAPLTHSVRIATEARQPLEVHLAEIPPVDRRSKDKLIGNGTVQSCEAFDSPLKLDSPIPIWFDRKVGRLVTKSKKGIALGKCRPGEPLLVLTADGKWHRESVQTSCALPIGSIWATPLTPLQKKPVDIISVIFDSKSGAHEVLRLKIEDSADTLTPIKIKRSEQIVLVSRFDRARGDGKLKVGERMPITSWPAMVDILKTL